MIDVVAAMVTVLVIGTLATLLGEHIAVIESVTLYFIVLITLQLIRIKEALK